MQGDSTRGQLAGSEWVAFIAKLEAAEHEFAHGRPAAFKALWSHSDDASICGAFGGVESGWDKVASRLDWASSQFSDGTRTREEIRSAVGADFAYIVQTEQIRFRVPGRTEHSTRPAGDDGVSARGGRMANRASTGRFTEEHAAAMKIGGIAPSNTGLNRRCNTGGSARIRYCYMQS